MSRRQQHHFSISLFHTVPLLTGVLLALTSPLGAEEIFKYVDKNGKVHFSTSPQSGGAKAELPKVKKENFDERLQRVRAETPPNCEKRGGIDCARGPDVDGSVVCLDGFSGSTLAFHSHCGTIRLQADAPRVLDGAGTLIDAKVLHSVPSAADSAKTVTMTLRSLSALPAEDVRVELTFPRLPTPLQAEGPTTVDPYGFAEYTARLDPIRNYVTRENLRKLVIRVKCSKCSPESESLR